MTHQEKIMKWFRTHKYLDRVQAMTKLNIFNLTADISDMRAAGIDIESVYPNVKGKKARWCKYRLKANE